MDVYCRWVWGEDGVSGADIYCELNIYIYIYFLFFIFYFFNVGI